MSSIATFDEYIGLTCFEVCSTWATDVSTQKVEVGWTLNISISRHTMIICSRLALRDPQPSTSIDINNRLELTAKAVLL